MLIAKQSFYHGKLKTLKSQPKYFTQTKQIQSNWKGLEKYNI